jgi:hypothetical protein
MTWQVAEKRDMPPRLEDTKRHQGNGQIGLLPWWFLVPWCLCGEKGVFQQAC